MAGKGSTRRPRDNKYCTAKEYKERYDAIYGKKKKKGRDRQCYSNQKE